MKLFDSTLTTLGHALDVRLAKQTMLAQTVANADTPGFKPKDVDFGASMQAALAADHSPELPLEEGTIRLGAEDPAPVLVESSAKNAGLDGNQVDLDHTLASLAENAISYEGAAKAANRKLATLRYVASDGNA